MEIKNLRTLYYTSKFLNFTKTADFLGLSQPAVTAQIQSLENELGVQLFIRIGKKVYLTLAGEIAVKMAEKILNDIDLMKDTITKFSCSEGQLRIAAYETFCVNDLQPIIFEFIRSFPEVEIKVFACDTQKVTDGVKSGIYDIGIISGEINGTDDFYQIKIGEDPVMLVTSQKCYKHYSKTQLLTELPLIKYLTSVQYGQELDNFVEKNKLSNNRKVLTFSSLEAVKSAVMHNIGIAVLTRDIVIKQLISGEIVGLKTDHENIMIATSLIYSKRPSNMNSIQRFCEVVQKYWK